MRRREFITLLGGAAAAWPMAARAEPGDRVRRIGVLVPAYKQADREGQARIAAFLDTLHRLGWSDGRNVRIEYLWGSGDAGRIKSAAAGLIHASPDVVVVSANPALHEVHRLTSTIPIVFNQVSDPVRSGFVTNLARPGSNITGFERR